MLKYTFLIFFSVSIISCGKDEKNNNRRENVHNSDSVNTLKNNSKLQISEFKGGDYETFRLKVIRENYRRINSIANWSEIKKEKLFETTEGGEASYYYQKGNLDKITTQNYGETFQLITEYYLLEGQLCFVYEKLFQYNRPMYYDIAAMKENNDTESFDLEKSKVTESRSYFENGQLFLQTSGAKVASSTKKDSLKNEQQRILSDFKMLIGKQKNDGNARQFRVNAGN